MQETTANGLRREFSIGFITANREAWAVKKSMRDKLKNMVPGSSEFIQLEKEMNKLDIGGRFIEHEPCILSGQRGMHVNSRLTPNPYPNGEGSNSRKGVLQPNHSGNRTRNIVFLPGNHIRKIHNSLLFFFNGQEVMY